MLDGLRVVDLTDDRGSVGTFILAALGAEVVRVEPPEGSPERRVGPFHESDSLTFDAYNGGKKSVILDPGDTEDRKRLRTLLSGIDILVDSGVPGHRARYGLDRAGLEEANSELIVVSVTATGSDGPRVDDAASELTIAALGGPVRITGTEERAPLQSSVPQTWRHAGAEAATAALVALARREKQGGAQFVDVSAQAAMTWTMLNAMEASQIQGHDFERTGATLKLAMELPIRRAAKDGYVILVPRGPAAGALTEVLQRDEIVGSEWSEEEWLTWDHRTIEGEPTLISPEQVVAALDAFCGNYTKQELLDIGIEVGASIAPINNVSDLADFDQLTARQFWNNRAAGDNDEDSAVATPGGFILVDNIRVASPEPVPTLGQHQDELLEHLENPTERFAIAETGDRLPPTGRPFDGLPFDGLKVADFSWIGVGPMTTKCLADHGATVVRVESASRIDRLRSQVPFKDGEFGWDRSHFFGTFNTSKLSLTLDLKNEGGISAAMRLVDWADVVVDSFTPGAMDRLGLGPDAIRSRNPSVITVTTSLLGNGGPYSSLAGYGYHAAAIAGFFDLVGWPDLPPDGPWLAYTDTIGPRFIIPTLLAALRRRKTTGRGCHIEAAQLEMALQFLAPELLDFAHNGTVAQRQGNRHRSIAPQGVYQCDGRDCWVAISIVDDECWERFRVVMGDPGWARGAVLGSVSGRMSNHDAVDTGIQAWTIKRTEAEVEQACLAADVAAAKVQRSSDLFVDPAYHHRDFYRWHDHEEMGSVPYASHAYRIEGYHHGPRFAAPKLGQHTIEVLTELLGYDIEELAELAATGCLE